MLILLFLILICSQDKSRATPTEQTNELAEEMITFKAIGELSANNDVAHLSCYLNLSYVISQQNKMAGFLDKAREEVISHAQNQNLSLDNIKLAFSTLAKDLEEARKLLQFLCLLISCQDTIQHNKFLEKEPDSIVVNTENEKEYGKISKLYSQGTWWRSHFEANRKRQAFLGLLGIIGIGLSGYNVFEIQNLKAELTSAESKQKRLASILKAEDTIIKENVMQIQLLEDQLSKYEKITNMLVFWEQIEMSSIMINVFTSNIDHWIDGVLNAVIRGQLTARLFSTTSLQKAVKNIQVQASFYNLEMASPDIKDVLNEDLSYISDPQGVFIIVHLPLAEMERMEIYKYFPTPLRFREGQFFIPQPEANYIAANPTLTESITFDQPTLKECLKRGSKFLCDFGLTQTNPTDTCLGSLYAGNIDSIVNLCHFRSLKTRATELIIQTGKLQIKIFPQFGRNVTIQASCQIAPNSSNLTIDTPTTLNLAPGCHVQTANYKFKNSQGFDIKERFVERKIIGFANLSSIKLEIPSLNWQNFSYNPILVDENQFEELGKEIPQKHINSAVLLFVLILTLFLLIGIGYLLWRVKKTDWQNRSSSPQQTTLGDSGNDPLTDHHVVKLEEEDHLPKTAKRLMDFEIPFIKFKFAE